MHLFAYLPGQPGYNKRLRLAQAQLRALIAILARETDLFCDDVFVVDSAPLECGRSRPTAERSDLAGYGCCASHPRCFPGLGLHLLCTPAGLPVAFALASPKADEREVLRDLLGIDPELLRPGQVIIADTRAASVPSSSSSSPSTASACSARRGRTRLPGRARAT